MTQAYKTTLSDVDPGIDDFETPRQGEAFLMTPGPLTTAYDVKAAMLRDWGTWDKEFRLVTAELQQRILSLLDGEREHYACVPIQGSGTFAVEAMLGSFIPPEATTLILVNGSYGKRAAKILDYMGRAYQTHGHGELLPIRGADVTAILDRDASLSHVFIVHCETSTGILNPLDEITAAVKAAGRKLLIDSVSAFGAMKVHFDHDVVEAVACSSNKCFEGVPGVGFVIARRAALDGPHHAHSLSLDLHDQWHYMNQTQQWRFTPPTHIVVAFLEALRQHESEGGQPGRQARYQANCDALISGMRSLGFRTLIDEAWLSPLIVGFHAPAHPAYDFTRFYEGLKHRGFIIYPGKQTEIESFRIGCMGRLNPAIMKRFVTTVRATLDELGVDDASPDDNILAAIAVKN